MRIRMTVTLVRPSERNPGGTAIYGSYEHEEANGTLRVYDGDDHLLATAKVDVGDDVRARAVRLLREKSGAGDDDWFNRPIEYPQRGIV